MMRLKLGIEVVQSSSSIVINQHKYAMDILTETGMLDYLPCDTFYGFQYQASSVSREAIEIHRKILTPSRQTQLSHYHQT